MNEQPKMENELSEKARPITIFMCGDVMTGRGIDQILPHPGNPVLHEAYIKDARDYVELAEEVNGPIPRPVDFSYIWGYALHELERMAPDVRLINLETSVTTSDEHWENKGIHYRMHPRNIPCITAAGIDCCSLANNHIVDWGYTGLEETLGTLREENIRSAGAGRNLEEAESPAVMEVAGKGRVLVFSYGAPTSGIPSSWAAETDRPGVNFIDDFSESTADRIREKVQEVKRKGDVVIASIHWGGNWGYEIPHYEQEFAHLLIDKAGIDAIHGHSSHHVKGLEVYNGKLILYGCGDFINDYEGIRGGESFRHDLALMYFASIDAGSGALVGLRMIPTQIRRFRVNRAYSEDALWLCDLLNEEGKRLELGTRTELDEDQNLILQFDPQSAGE